MNRLWAPWRMAYVGASGRAAGCIFCDALRTDDDRSAGILRRGPRAFLMLNVYPYTSGHLMAVVNRHVGTLRDATADEVADAMRLVQDAIGALTDEYAPHGFNVGINQGRVAGAGIEDHLHVHIVPRWNGDANFMSVIGEVRVLPESLDATWTRLRSRLSG